MLHYHRPEREGMNLLTVDQLKCERDVKRVLEPDLVWRLEKIAWRLWHRHLADHNLGLVKDDGKVVRKEDCSMCGEAANVFYAIDPPQIWEPEVVDA